MAEPRYVAGIDLGTSNSAVAYAAISKGGSAPVRDFSTLQIERVGQSSPRALLPSFIYLPTDAETASGGLKLEFQSEQGPIAGEYARKQGSRVPGRVVSSAKSWLCHAGVDRTAAILPWGASAEVKKLSPVHASALLLRHIRDTWDYEHPGEPLADQDVVITVPASFDEVARSLTVQAAKEAGLEKFTLLEEPQAAFYDFTSRHRKDLAEALRTIRLALVVDVGGGTTDFTLVQVASTPEGPIMRRIAVGDHLILGGDNMDSTLARRLEEKLLATGKKLNATQWSQLVQVARSAKETLLGENPPPQINVAIAGEGSKLLGSALSASLLKQEAEELILHGFFTDSGPEAMPRKSSRSAIQELGLPYVQDPSITHHLAAFLRKHAEAGFQALGIEGPDETSLPRPDAILLNGGVFNSASIARRLVAIVSRWWPGNPEIPLLEHDSLDLAVARGAAYYGLVRRGMGQKIGGGAARAFYIGLGSNKNSDGESALCVIPRGMEEGESVELTERNFQLMLGKPVQFPIYSTTSDRVDRAGDVVKLTEELNPLPPIHTILKSPRERVEKIPVHLRAKLTEIGTLELWCVSREADQQWRLEFELRGSAGESEMVVTESMPAHFAEARQWIEHIFGNKPISISPKGPPPPRDVKQLWASLERTLGPRESWPVPVLRELWGALIAGAAKRRRSADHEKVWLQLTGFVLRPGYGYPLDEWRCEETFKIFSEKVEFHKEKPIWNEFWVMWRRIAGGLSEARQLEMWNYLRPVLEQRVPVKPPKNIQRVKGVQPDGYEEMVRTAASLENVSPAEKTWLGDLIISRLREQPISGGPWLWTLGRLGTRVPIRGSSHHVVAPQVAAGWIHRLTSDFNKLDGVAFAVTQMARFAGDRARDLTENQRSQALQFLETKNVSPAWVKMVRELVRLEKADESRVLGDTLPAGLQLV
ncbi:MAG: Hsp70 family protein [Verrucomicrobiales bacterium]